MKPPMPQVWIHQAAPGGAKKRTHVKYIPRNAARCLYCKRSWWVP